MKTPVITATDICIGYRTKREEKRVHERLSFRLYPGEVTCLLGANGTGKSTLLRTLSGVQPALSGELYVQGKMLARFSEKERSRTIGIVLTDKTSAGGLTVYDLVALGRQPHTGFFGLLNKKDHHLIGNALEAVGITHKAGQYMAELSDGERQKVMIARALVQECPLILLDEPTAYLDVVSRIEIMSLLHRLATEQGKAILLSTHDIEQALTLADKLWLLSKETGLICGVTEDLILSGRMDGLFPQSDIRFDYAHGSFYPQVGGGIPVAVEAKDEILRHWTVNALNRQGYICPSHTPETSVGIPLLQAIAPDRLILHMPEGRHEFTSFKDLLPHLRSLHPHDR